MDVNFPQLEKKILNFWRDKKIFEKSLNQRQGAGNFVFYEGPPTANARPGIHHVLSRAFKDIAARYKTMQGFLVLRKAGWDTHGLPVELEIEKKLGLKSKKDIERYGIARFNKLCRESTWNYKKDWEQLTERIAFWLDMEHPYVTYETDYIESVWWIIKQIFQKGLLYKDYKVVPYCPRCGTSLSSHEVALGYKEVKENSVYIKFKLVSDDSKWKNTSILSWTTTPWTLPGNVALAVNPKITYLKVKVGEETIILAKERANVLGQDYKVVGELAGKSLLGLAYKPLFNVSQLKTKNSHKVYPANFVTAKEGTGIVHIAGMYGVDDYNLSKKAELPAFHTVSKEGKFVKTLGEGLANKYVKDKQTESLILSLLAKKESLFSEELYQHDYPFCWRCSSPLLYYAKESWFINMQKVKKDLIQNNQRINWVPGYLKEGRFGEWLKEIKDWAFSRERYWGTPLPVWQCQKCGKLEVIGSKKDLVSQKFSKNRYFLLRHGESLNNKKGVISSWPEKKRFPLTENGESQILEAAGQLKKEKISLIFSSDLLRTKQTASIVGKELGIKPVFEKGLREINVGTFNGKSLLNAVARFWDKKGKLPSLEYYSKRFQVAPPRGENYIQVEQRVYDFLKETDSKYRDKNILLVSHGRVFTLLEKMVYGYSLEEFIKVVLDKKEMKNGEVRRLEFNHLPYNENLELDFHRPFIDEVKFSCSKCGSLAERVPEIIDVWFDSGSMPFSQHHYPFENADLIDQKIQFPAEYISEAIDQTRGWFYTLHAISTLLGKGPAFRNVISLGHVLDEKGEKMSKSKGNVVEPHAVIEKYGADALRWYFFTVNQPGDSKLFSEKDIDQAFKKFILTFWNALQFFETYTAGIKRPLKLTGQAKVNNVLDRWIISRFNTLTQEVTKNLDKYDITGAARAIEDFIVNDLSNWYIRRSRRRFQRPEAKGDFEAASKVLGHIMLELSLLSAPFVPFLAEEVYQRLTGSVSSVHLADWPKASERLIDKKLEEKMAAVRKIVALALAERSLVGIKARQPLSQLRLRTKLLKTDQELLGLIKEEVNVKEVILDPALKKEVELDTEITPELQEEGQVREIIRNIQEMRKRGGFKPGDLISVRYSADQGLDNIVTRNKAIILKEVKAKQLAEGDRPKQVFKIEREVMIGQAKLWFGIKKA